jgi:hypothetical protein
MAGRSHDRDFKAMAQKSVESRRRKKEERELADAAAAEAATAPGAPQPSDVKTGKVEVTENMSVETLRWLRDHASSDMARFQAAKYLDEREAQRADEERHAEMNEMTQMLGTLPIKERILTLQALARVRDGEEQPFRMVIYPDWIFHEGEIVFDPEGRIVPLTTA